MKLHIIRHAEPDYANHTITPSGHLEAEALAVRLKKQGLDAIYCSPLGRARHTMQYTKDALGLEANIEDWTQELKMSIVVDDMRLAAWNVTGDDVRANMQAAVHRNWEQIPYVDAVSSKIENALEEIRINSNAFLGKLGYVFNGSNYTIEQNSARGKDIAMFCHGGFGLSWIAHLLALPPALVWTGLWLATSSVTTVLFDERVDGFATPRCLCVGDTSHLHAAGLPISNAGLCSME